MAHIVNRFSQIARLPISEQFSQSEEHIILTLSIGKYSVRVYQTLGTTKKRLRSLACDLFNQTFAQQIDDVFNYNAQALDYLQYSRNTILKHATIHMNKIPDIKPSKIAFDSEGIPPVLAQICFDPNNVYLYTDLTYPTALLHDSKVEKIICDVQAEQRQFGTIPNATDIQGPDRKSLVTCVSEHTKIQLKKDKRVHMMGWRHPFTQDQIDYAAADALWIWIVSNKNNFINNNNDDTDNTS